MFDIFMDALIDASRMIPFLFIIYIGIGFVEYKFGNQIKDKVKHAGKAGPALGALFGCVPQCGFSVITTALYTKRLITLGTLLAVYISTSDEAIPVILSQPDKIGVILPLLLTKVAIALVAGYAIDIVSSNPFSNRPGLINPNETHCKNKPHSHTSKQTCESSEEDCCINSDENLHIEGKACCGHSCITDKPDYKELFIHPLIHTVKVFAFIFTVSLIINFIIFRIGEENLGTAFLSNSIFQPMIAGLIGLIPNCASSVAITEVFLKGGISYGSAIAGLSSSAGLGLIVLFKENQSRAGTLKILGLLYGISVISGIIIQYIYG